MLLILSDVFSKFGGLADFRLLLQLPHEVSRYQIDEKNRMIVSITYKASDTDLILLGSSISSSTSSLLVRSVTSSTGFSCFSVISFQIS